MSERRHSRPIGRLSGSQAFAHVRAGQRVRSGPVGLMVHHDPDRTPPRVAFAISRHLGSAVRRNRLRRQLRAILRTEPDVMLEPGDYVIRLYAPAASATYADLHAALRAALERASRG